MSANTRLEGERACLVDPTRACRVDCAGFKFTQPANAATPATTIDNRPYIDPGLAAELCIYENQPVIAPVSPQRPRE